MDDSITTVKPLAIYLPQYHSIPENDAAWGKGFTEWTNVKNAVPLFDGHYQPHIPDKNIGYYNLRDPEVLVRQAAMAREYGIYGFAFYHYWFNGKRLLETPLDNMLQEGKPDFPFLFIWANENWTRRWDGMDNEIIIKQDYSQEDDLIHIQYLCENVFIDNRYIKIDNKPVFIIYRTELFPDIKRTTEIWRREVKRYGFDDIYLVRVEHFASSNIKPSAINFDAAMEFAPHIKNAKNIYNNYKDSILQYTRIDYNDIVANAIARSYDHKVYRCVFPSWDNTARKKDNITIYSNPSYMSQLFSYYLSSIIDYTVQHLSEKEQFVFINAWNEWGEGCHIEPDVKNEYKYLEAIKNALIKNNVQIPIEYCHFLEKDRFSMFLDIKDFKTRHNSKYYKAFDLLFDQLRKIMRK
ncbi:hypothetical protein AGMMS49940_06720 [Spirochaetia bacterium]|nr:hypothetical protein AGMMS49940_06720 [Spirochaetia bacterium]